MKKWFIVQFMTFTGDFFLCGLFLDIRSIIIVLFLLQVGASEKLCVSHSLWNRRYAEVF